METANLTKAVDPAKSEDTIDAVLFPDGLVAAFFFGIFIVSMGVLARLMKSTLSRTVSEDRQRTIHDLGWSTEQAARVRAQLSSFADDWDSPEMNIYNDLPAATTVSTG
jgi:hypothetical protein